MNRFAIRKPRSFPIFVAGLAFGVYGLRAQSADIPRVWNDQALSGWLVPLAEPGHEPVPLSAEQFYRLPELKIYKSYAVYAPGREPAGYKDKLRQAQPELVFDASQLRTDADWIRAGELVFEAPVTISSLDVAAYIGDPAWNRDHHVPMAKDGTVPFYRYIVREKGKVELGTLSCANCHTRVLPDGSVIEGAQGNFPRAQSNAYLMRHSLGAIGETAFVTGVRAILTHDYGTPWLRNDLNTQLSNMSGADLIAAFEAAPAGITPCHDSSLFSPVQVPDLIGIGDRKYLDHTGHALHRGIADLMRFAAYIQENTLSGFGDYILPPSVPGFILEERMSDSQLYALARYLYSLRPPQNPNRPSELTARGADIFKREGCEGCHTPPFYTNNTLTPARGFVPPADHLTKYSITQTSVGTDSTLALRTRKGTGYYKVPSLRGVWYRGPFEHNGSVATLEDWFDPTRLGNDYVPTGFKGVGVKTRAIKGHEFGLRLGSGDKAALIAFLRTL